MAYHVHSAGRAITDYFNSQDFHPSGESELLEAMMSELMQGRKTLSDEAIIANAFARQNGEVNEAQLQEYRNLLAKKFSENS